MNPESLQKACAVVQEAFGPVKPVAALVLGSGLGGFVDSLTDPKILSYSDIPGFPPSTVAGHAGRLVAANLAGKPVLIAQDVRLDEPPRIVGQDRTHMMLQIRSGTAVIKALAFGMASREHELRMSRPIDLVFTPRLNHWRGRTAVELIVSDFQCR